MRRNLIFLILILVVLAGCTHTVNVALRPNFGATLQPGNELSNVEPAIQFFKGEFADKRPDPSSLARFKQGLHSYTLYEERSVEEALFEGFGVLIETSGHKWSSTEEGEVKVNIEFINLTAARAAGLIEVSATSGIQIKVDFLDAKTGDMIYTNIFSGADNRKQALIGLMGMVKDSIDWSIVKCIQSVGDDAGLSSALKKFLEK